MLSPTTELEAVNSMLATIGESPVSTVDDTGVVDAAIALKTLREVSREVQTRGWHFNTDVQFKMTPSFPDGEIQLPKNILRIDTVRESAGIDVASRGKRLYNRSKHNFVFEKPVIVDMVVLLTFEDLPEFARGYIATRASRLFQKRTVGSLELDSLSGEDEARALMLLNEAEAETADYNVLTDNYDVARILHR